MSLLFPVINFYKLFSPCWLQREFVSSSCVLEYSHGECAGPRRHRTFSGWKQISGLLLSRHAYPLSPQPLDLQLEGRTLHVYTDSASLRGTAVSVALVSPWCLLLLANPHTNTQLVTSSRVSHRPPLQHQGGIGWFLSYHVGSGLLATLNRLWVSNVLGEILLRSGGAA